MADATTGDHIWAEQYDRDLDDIFAVQDEVTQIIVATLTERIRLAGAERARRKQTSLLAAYEYVLRGRECFHKWNSIDNLNAYEMFSQAAEIDPDYALAYAHMAHAEYANWIAGWSKAPIATFNHFCELAEQALMLDDFESMTHNMIALAHLYRRRHDEARLHVEKALELSPNDADVVMIAGYVAMFDGEQETALERVNQAARLNPFGRYGIALGMALFSAKRYQEAIVALATARGKLPHVQAYLAASYAYIGAVGQAQAAVSQLIDVASSEMVKVGAEVPENWSKFLLEKFPYRLQTDLDHLLLGLRKAGVHE